MLTLGGKNSPILFFDTTAVAASDSTHPKASKAAAEAKKTKGTARKRVTSRNGPVT